MGELKGTSLAEKLKMKSDAQHVSINDRIRAELANSILRETEVAANAGLYAVTLYDERVENTEISKPLKKLLQAHGFKVSIGRTRGLGKVCISQAYITVSWK